MSEHPSNSRGIKTVTLVLDPQPQFQPWHRHHSEGIVCAGNTMYMADLYAAAPLLYSGTRRIVLKAQETLKEGYASRYLTPALHLYKGTVLILTRLRLLGLEVAQPGEEQCLRRYPYPDWQGVDKKPDH